MTVESLPHPGADLILKRVRDRLMSHGVPIAERVRAAWDSPFHATLEIARTLRKLQDAPCVFVYRSTLDALGSPAATDVHEALRDELWTVVGGVDTRRHVLVRLCVDPHESFESVCVAAPHTMPTLDDIDRAAAVLERRCRRSAEAGGSILEIACPPDFEDDDAFLARTSETIVGFFTHHISQLQAHPLPPASVSEPIAASPPIPISASPPTPIPAPTRQPVTAPAHTHATWAAAVAHSPPGPSRFPAAHGGHQ